MWLNIINHFKMNVLFIDKEESFELINKKKKKVLCWTFLDLPIFNINNI